MSQKQSRQQRRAAARAQAKKDRKPAPQAEIPVELAAPPPDGPTPEGPPDGVWVTVKYGENGAVSIQGVSTTGTTRASEVESILKLGLKNHRQQTGIPEN